MKFLERTAGYLLEKYSDSLRETCIILPNRRGGLFLKKYLASASGKTFWPPEVYSVEDFFVRITGFNLIGQIEQLFELYEVHRELAGEKQEPFIQFLSWGPQLIHDFTEADSYLANPDELFTYLSEARAISLWNPAGGTLTDFEKRYLDFYRSLLHYYKGFHSRLKNSGKAYPGLLFRHAAENIERIAEKLPWKKIVIAGFNAMTHAEEVVYDHLEKSGKAEFLWDTDDYYINGEIHEAGYFLRKWKNKWGAGNFNWSENKINTEREIIITAVPDNIGQVKYCGKLLKEMIGSGIPPEEIAVVLPDEQLLMPLLNSVPSEVQDLNVTMGMPLRHTPLFSFIDLVFRLHLNGSKLTGERNKDNYPFYFRDLLSVLHHPYMVKMSGRSENLFAPDDLARIIRKGNRIFYTGEEILTTGSGLFGDGIDFVAGVLKPWKDPSDAVTCIKNIIDHLKSAAGSTSGDKLSGRIDLEYLYSFSLIIHQLETLLERFDSITDTETLYKLFIQIAGTTKLPFYGEPLKGVQVMGMLETRTLDFSKVIILSVNEGVLPSAKSHHSFIPFDIRRDFNLPTYQHNNSIYAYHFYRLIQHPSSVFLLYNTTGDIMGGGEKSRFISQINEELKKCTVKNQILSSSPASRDISKEVSVPKDDHIMEKLRKKALIGFSPTALNNYRRCPLKFYFREVAGIKPPDESDEVIDNAGIGNIIHECLKEIYTPLINARLTPEIVKRLNDSYEPALIRAFDKEMPGCNITSGRNMLIFQVAGMLIRNLIKWEAARVTENPDYKIAFLEEPLAWNMLINSGTEKINVTLAGRTDRIDEIPEGWLVLDYKTGSFKESEMKPESWEGLKTLPEADKAFQLLMYALLFQKKMMDPDVKTLSGIISLKNLSEEIPLVKIPEGDCSLDLNNMKPFVELVKSLLEEIFDPSVPFSQPEDENACNFCDYLSFCSR